MSAHVIPPTPYPDVNAVLDLLLSGVQTVLGDHFIGLYLYGSLASGDFDPQRSDIDFVVVTADELPDDTIAALEAMHTRIWASGLKWAAKLEGSYMPQTTLRRYDSIAAPCPQVNEGRFYVACQGSDWVIQRYILRNYGVAVIGPPLRTWIDPVPPNDLRRAVAGILRDWWLPMLEDPARLLRTEYQAFAILTMCRALYTLEYGTVVSKTVAARWAQQTLGKRWAAAIDWALVWRHDEPSSHLDDALDLIRYTLEYAGHMQILANDT